MSAAPAPFVAPQLVTVPKADTVADLTDANGNQRKFVSVAVTDPNGGQITQAAGTPVTAIVKHWYSSVTMWLSISGIAEAVIEAVVPIIVPMVSGTAPVDWHALPNKLVRPALQAALLAFLAYRRKTENTVLK